MTRINLMKSICFAFLNLTLFACNKKEITIPSQQSSSQATAIQYKDDNVFIKDFKAVTGIDNQVSVSFSTLYEKGIKKIELMSGSTENQLCTIYLEYKNTDSFKFRSYSFADTHPKSKEVYYMIRYSMNNGDWGYTPIYKYQSR